MLKSDSHFHATILNSNLNVFQHSEDPTLIVLRILMPGNLANKFDRIRLLIVYDTAQNVPGGDLAPWDMENMVSAIKIL
jgi:hypothetical protein